MKNYIRYGAIALLVIGCYDNDVLSPKIDDTLDLGTTSKSTLFKTQRITTSSGKVMVELAVTPGALYSLQLMTLDGRVIAVEGFRASEINTVVDLDYSKVPNGSYDLNLLDISGNITKIPVIINKQ